MKGNKSVTFFHIFLSNYTSFRTNVSDFLLLVRILPPDAERSKDLLLSLGALVQAKINSLVLSSLEKQFERYS